jgi:single-stranded-DNA-specific exonuclease
MEKAKDIFIEFGGHRGAGGFSVSSENIHKLEDRLNEAFIEIQSKMPSPGLGTAVVDKRISLDDVSWELWNEVEKFAPFGFENPKPTFLLENLKVKNIKRFGKEKNHLELQFEKSEGNNVSAIAFFTTPDKFSVPIEIGGKINLVATLEKSVFRNYPELRLRIVDIF